MNRAPWFLVSYDIADPRRLRAVHRLLRGCAHPLLESLFAFQGDVLALRRELAERIKPAEDDLLIYRLRPGEALHRWGRACAPEGVYDLSLPPLVEHRNAVDLRAENWSNFTQLPDQKTISIFDPATY